MTSPGIAAHRRDTTVISLIGIGHGFSHFYQLALPPLFLIINHDLGYGFGELGVLITIFFVVSGLAQIPLGFLVDRFGAKTLLYLGLGLEAGATLLYGVMPGYGSLAVLSALAGLGNGAFHPANFSILGATIDEPRMGRAFSVHSITGFVGYAAAPVVMVSLAGYIGWQAALIAVGAVGLGFLAVLMRFGRAFRDGTDQRAETVERPTLAGDIRLLLQIPFVMYLLFFILFAFAFVTLQTQGPPSISALYATSIATATATLTAFLIANPIGAIFGGIVADRTGRHETITTVCLLITAIMTLLGGLAGLGDTLMIAAFFVGGLAFGAFFPSRDMLVRRATPPGESGKVFGFVYSGLDLGSAFAPPLFGWLIDQGRAEWTFLGIAIALLASVTTVYGARLGTVRSARAAEINP